ncbi:hypothetical protein IQ07DRAFT_590470 [Pyrenochaeta sp. DS3sAY3a]|nr:hypothetical protein IQ07DRAFT_590470 [Pyrenochaeta sp. DS3sAY3a]
MEAVGAAAAALQLLGTCIEGFMLLTTAHNLGKDASTIVCMLNLQEIHLTDWARQAGLLTGKGELDRRLNAAAVEETLRQIQKLLKNSDELKTRYHLKLVEEKPEGYITTATKDPNDSEKTIVFTGISEATREDILTRAKIAQKTNFAKRLWWAAVDKEKIEKLVGDIHFLIRGLWDLITPLRNDDFANSLDSVLSNVVRMNTGFQQLVTIKESLVSIQARLEAKDAKAEPEVGTLATTAELKAVQIALEYTDNSTGTPNRTEIPKRQEMLKKLERLSRQKLASFTPLKKDDTRGTAVYDGEIVFVEWKYVTPAMRSKILSRAENLAALLSIRKDQTFQSLICKGLLEDYQRLGFIYQQPSGIQPLVEPRSLLDFFSKGGIEPPSLSDRIRLALRLAQVVRNFHRTGWLHKGLRSENILFFNAKDASVAVRSTDFVLTGFNFARLAAPTEISDQPSADPKHDIYRHPSALGQPSVSFDELMDTYSLGVILLEIAEWRAVRYLVDSVVDVSAEEVPLDRLASVRPFLLDGKGKGGTTKLLSKMGEIYTSACLMCLRGGPEKSGSQSEDVAVQKSVLDEVIKLLQSCRV